MLDIRILEANGVIIDKRCQSCESIIWDKPMMITDKSGKKPIEGLVHSHCAMAYISQAINKFEKR